MRGSVGIYTYVSNFHEIVAQTFMKELKVCKWDKRCWFEGFGKWPLWLWRKVVGWSEEILIAKVGKPFEGRVCKGEVCFYFPQSLPCVRRLRCPKSIEIMAGRLCSIPSLCTIILLEIAFMLAFWVGDYLPPIFGRTNKPCDVTNSSIVRKLVQKVSPTNSSFSNEFIHPSLV